MPIKSIIISSQCSTKHQFPTHDSQSIFVSALFTASLRCWTWIISRRFLGFQFPVKVFQHSPIALMKSNKWWCSYERHQLREPSTVASTYRFAWEYGEFMRPLPQLTFHCSYCINHQQPANAISYSRAKSKEKEQRERAKSKRMEQEDRAGREQ